MFKLIASTILLTAVLSLDGFAQAPQPTAPRLHGKIRISAQQSSPDVATLMIESSIREVAAIVVRAPEAEEDLLRITTDAFREALEKGREDSPAPKSSLSLDLPTLTGRFHQRLDYDLTQGSVLEVQLLLQDGREIPVLIRSPRALTDTAVEISFNKRVPPCYNVSLDCSGCTPETITCCNLPIEVCADCTRCFLSCYSCPP